MPSLGFGEIIVILLVALIVFGPRRLPEIGRSLGKSVREFRRATSSLRAELEDGLDDAPPPAGPARWREQRHARQRGNGESGSPTEPVEASTTEEAEVPPGDPPTAEGPTDRPDRPDRPTGDGAD